MQVTLIVFAILENADDKSQSRKRSFVGTAQYVSPEVLKSNASYYRCFLFASVLVQIALLSVCLVIQLHWELFSGENYSVGSSKYLEISVV